MMRFVCYFALCVGIVSANSFYTPSFKGRRSPEQTLFRAEVAPETGGKVPESAHMRVELNRIDAMGFDDPAAEGMVAQLRDQPLPDKMPENYHAADPYEHPGQYAPAAPHYTPVHEPAYHQPEPAYHPEPAYQPEKPYQPYQPPAYEPPAYAHPEPEPGYGYEPEPAYGPPPSDAYGPPAHHHDHYKPKGPVMLDKRPYEPKEIKPVTITTHDTYTGFDCRKTPYPDRHYADPEAGCQIYHYCHADGKQDTFHCPYGTIFNEYLGTCDHSGAVYCKGGEGYAGPPKHHAPEPAYHHPEPHVNYDYAPAPYHTPEPSHHHHSSGFGSGFDFPKGFGSHF